MAAHPTHVGDAPELALGAIDVRALARRAALPAAVVAVLAVAVVAGAGPLRAFGDALARAVQADPRWVGGAAVLELLSFAGYIALLWLVASRATRRVDLRASAQITLGGAGATRLLPTGGVGGVALTLWALRRAGLGGREATRTLLAFLVVLYSVFLGAIVAAGGLLALGIAHGDGPLSLSAVPAAGAALGILLPLAAAARRPARGVAGAAEAGTVRPGRAARARARLDDAAGVLGGAVRDALGLVRSGDPRLLGALAWWAFDAAVLWAMLNAFGTPPGLVVVVLAYFVGQLGNTIPIPGAVSGGIVGVLIAFGGPADLALVSVLAYRAIAIWLPASVGLAALRPLQRTIAGWKAGDATAPQPPALALAPRPAGIPARAPGAPAPEPLPIAA